MSRIDSPRAGVNLVMQMRVTVFYKQLSLTSTFHCLFTPPTKKRGVISSASLSVPCISLCAFYQSLQNNNLSAVLAFQVSIKVTVSHSQLDKIYKYLHIYVYKTERHVENDIYHTHNGLKNSVR